MTATKTLPRVTGTTTIDISNRNFLNKFLPSLNELSMLPSNKESGQLKYAVKKTLTTVQIALDSYNFEKQQIFEDRAKVDENGNPMFDDKREYIFESKESRTEAFAELKKLDETIIKLSVYPIRKENVIKATKNISIALELSLEGFIICDEEDFEEEQN